VKEADDELNGITEFKTGCWRINYPPPEPVPGLLLALLFPMSLTLLES
jgi:hypothetical protein